MIVVEFVRPPEVPLTVRFTLPVAAEFDLAYVSRTENVGESVR